MNQNHTTDPEKSRESELTRRACLGYGITLVGLSATASLASLAQAQTAPALIDTTRSMFSITGTLISEARLQNATGLFGVILVISKELRKIDLGEIEPAPTFTAK